MCNVHGTICFPSWGQWWGAEKQGPDSEISWPLFFLCTRSAHCLSWYLPAPGTLFAFQWICSGLKSNKDQNRSFRRFKNSQCPSIAKTLYTNCVTSHKWNGTCWAKTWQYILYAARLGQALQTMAQRHRESDSSSIILGHIVSRTPFHILE